MKIRRLLLLHVAAGLICVSPAFGLTLPHAFRITVTRMWVQVPQPEILWPGRRAKPCSAATRTELVASSRPFNRRVATAMSDLISA